MDSAIQGIERRRWDIISERWRNYLPDTLQELPDAYEPPVENEVLRERMESVGSLDQFVSIGDAPVIRTLVFDAARFSGERCLYFTRTAESLARGGMPTAAVITSYLGMLFGSRCLLSLLGIYYCFHENRTWLVDIWPGASETTSQGRLKDWTPRIFGLVSGQRMGHQLHWQLFIRVRSVTTRLPLSDGAMSVLRKLRDHGSFSAHRNDIHYNDLWPYPDLYALLNNAEIGLLPAGWDVDVDDLDHNLKVAQIIGFCSAHMLLDVLSPLPKFREYCGKLKRRLLADWHPILNAGALSSGLERLQGEVASA